MRKQKKTTKNAKPPKPLRRAKGFEKGTTEGEPMLNSSRMIRLSVIATAALCLFTVTGVHAQFEKMEIVIGPVLPPTRAINECPTLTLRAPDAPIFDGDQAGFILKIEGGIPKVIPLIGWSISAGTVLGGGDSTNLVIDTDGASSDRGVRVSVIVGGYPPKCETTATIFLRVLRKISCKRTVPSLIRCYSSEKDDEIRAGLLRTMAAYRDPRIAIVFGKAISESGSIDVRLAAVNGLIFSYIGYVVDGGTEQNFEYANTWWLKNRDRLEAQAKAKTDQDADR